MVRLSIAFTAPSARAVHALLSDLRFLEPVTRLQPGCLRCSNWTEPDRTIHHMEEWESEDDIQRRVRHREFTALLELVEAARNPRVQFDFVAVTRGLDYVAEVRGAFGS